MKYIVCSETITPCGEVKMGWYGTPNASRQDIIDEILADLQDQLQEHAVVVEDGTTVLWGVVKGTRGGNEYQYIVCYLITCEQGCWGYKPMDESMGPCYYSVPKHWITRYPCIAPGSNTGFSQDWRDKVLLEGKR